MKRCKVRKKNKGFAPFCVVAEKRRAWGIEGGRRTPRPEWFGGGGRFLSFPVGHALISVDFSKENGEGFLYLTVALKRHPCRIGLNWSSMTSSPYAVTFS